MAAIDLAGTMDALALKLTTASVSARVFAYPIDDAPIPAVVVGYPEDIEFDQTFGRGSDKAVFPLYFLVGEVTGKASRDALSAILTGATAVKNSLDGPLTVGANTATVRVTECRPESVRLGTVVYLSATFDCEVIT